MEKPKKHYMVVSCTNCGRYLLAVSDKKTRTCPYCGKRVSMDTAKVVAMSENPEEARAALQEMKTHEHGDRPGVKVWLRLCCNADVSHLSLIKDGARHCRN